jgi:hypothetical protein
MADWPRLSTRARAVTPLSAGHRVESSRRHPPSAGHRLYVLMLYRKIYTEQKEMM